MADPIVRSESVNVVQIMERIRARIRETRGAEYTDAQIRELANATLQRYLDPRGVRPDLVEQLQRAQSPASAQALPNFEFEQDTLFASTRPALRWIRKLLLPILKLFFNPNPLIQALHIQSQLNTGTAEREARRDAARYAFDQLHYEAMHNIVVEMTRLGVEMKHLRMQVESLNGRLEFAERRGRATESAIAQVLPSSERAATAEYRPEPTRQTRQTRPAPDREAVRRTDDRDRTESRSTEVAEAAEPAAPPTDAQTSTRSRRRRRRRGRRGGAGTPAGDATQATAGLADPADGAVDDPLPGDGDEATGEDYPSDNGMEGSGPDADAASGTEDREATEPHSSVVATQSDAADSRTARPEPFEHTFGAQAHPAEPAAGDPASRDDRVDNSTQPADPTIAPPPTSTES